MIDKIVEDQIQLYLKYSLNKSITMDDYIKIRQQVMQEYNSGMHSQNVLKSNATSKANSTMSTSDASGTSNAIKASGTYTDNNTIDTIKIDDNADDNDISLLEILKSVQE